MAKDYDSRLMIIGVTAVFAIIGMLILNFGGINGDLTGEAFARLNLFKADTGVKTSIEKADYRDYGMVDKTVTPELDKNVNFNTQKIPTTTVYDYNYFREDNTLTPASALGDPDISVMESRQNLELIIPEDPEVMVYIKYRNPNVCHDSDDADPYLSGTMYYDGEEYEDVCSNNDLGRLLEYSCTESNGPRLSDVDCGNVCMHGRCYDECIDLEEGPYEEYTVGSIYYDGTEFTDTCSGGTLVEYYCSGENGAIKYIECAGTCSNGMCI